MLIYLGDGERRYGINPISPIERRGWEFQAVLRGSIAPVFPSGPQPLRTAHLWGFPPGHVHGWSGDRTHSAEVAVFHFLSAPELLNRLLSDKGYLEFDLSGFNIRKIRELVHEVKSYWNRPAQGMVICYEHALLELALLACEKGSSGGEETDESYPQSRVNAAIVWYAERMPENPAFPDVARAVGVSTSHLRRLFHEVLQASPNQIMDQLRFQRATQLMSDSATKLESVGYECGFASASAFSRAFKMRFGCSPQLWRADKFRRS